LEALNNNGIICSFSAEMILEHIGRMAKDYGSSYLLAIMYDSKKAFIDNCIEVVCCS
jgi:hypothetical protein